LKCLRLPATKMWKATQKNVFKNPRFEPPFGGLRGNVQASSMARRKARGRLPISANWTFVASYHAWGTITACTVVQATACTVIQAVAKANSQSNGKGQILTPWGSETPEQISMKLGIYNQVAGMPTHANPCGAATTWVVWANTWKNTCCGFLGVPFLIFNFFNFLLYSSARAEPAKVDRFWRSIGLRHTTCFRPRMCLLRVSFILFPVLGEKSPKTPILGEWIGIFKFNAQNIKICILSKLLHRLQPNFAQSQRPPDTLRGWSQHA